MADRDKNSIMDKFEPSELIKEGVKAGPEYLPSKTALQFYHLGKGVSEAKAKEAAARMRELEALGYSVDIPKKGTVETMLELIDSTLRLQALRAAGYKTHIPRHGSVEVLAEYVRAMQQKSVSEEALQIFLALKHDERNHAHKLAIDEMTRKIYDDEMLLASSLSEKSKNGAGGL